MIRLFICWWCGVWLLTTPVLHAASLSVLGEDRFPPYSYTDDRGVDGLAVRVVETLLARLDSATAVELMPWIRAYQTALSEPDTLLFPTRRTADRESQFYWIGVVAPYQMSVYALEPNLQERIDNIEAAKPFRLGVLNSGYVELELTKQGFELGHNLFRVGHMVQNVRKLMNDRIDLLPIGDLSMAYILHDQFPHAESLPVPLFCFNAHQDEHLYLVLSKSTSSEVAERLSDELTQMHRDGTYDQILTSYLDEAGLSAY